MTANKPRTWYEVRTAAGTVLYRGEDWETARDDYLERLNAGESVELVQLTVLTVPPRPDDPPIH